MALIQWQTNAKRHLKSIFDYYRKNASLEVAFAMRDAIVNPVDRLEEFPLSGVVDHELSNKNHIYYYLIAKRGKRIYRIYYLYENETCYILAIWDCSMNPSRRKTRVVTRI